MTQGTLNDKMSGPTDLFERVVVKIYYWFVDEKDG